MKKKTTTNKRTKQKADKFPRLVRKTVGIWRDEGGLYSFDFFFRVMKTFQSKIRYLSKWETA